MAAELAHRQSPLEGGKVLYVLRYGVVEFAGTAERADLAYAKAKALLDKYLEKYPEFGVLGGGAR